MANGTNALRIKATGWLVIHVILELGLLVGEMKSLLRFFEVELLGVVVGLKDKVDFVMTSLVVNCLVPARDLIWLSNFAQTKTP